MALSGTVFIDRGNRADALKAFQGAAEEMRREKQNVFIFPEGTRSYANGPELGALKLAVQAGVDIVPVVAANYAGVLNVGKRRFRAGRIPVQGEFGAANIISGNSFVKVPGQEEEAMGRRVYTLTSLLRIITVVPPIST